MCGEISVIKCLERGLSIEISDTSLKSYEEEDAYVSYESHLTFALALFWISKPQHILCRADML